MGARHLIRPMLVVCVAALAALGTARAVDQLVRTPAAVQSARTRARPAAPRAQRREKDATPITARNLFCSTCTPAQTRTSLAAPGPVDLVLIGTQTDARVAAATVHSPDFAGAVTVGDRVAKVGTVTAIHARHMLLQTSTGRQVRVELMVQAKALSPSRRTPASELDAPGAPVWIDPTHMRVSRQWLMRLISNPRSGVVARTAPGGTGFLLVRLPRELAQGLRPGDVLVALDGRAVTSMDDALDAYHRFKSADRMTVDYLRGGQRHTLHVEVE